MLDYNYSKKEIKQLIDSMVVLIDTREQKNEYITKALDKKGIEYKNKSLRYGDYSFLLPENEDLGISKEISFANEIVIERKGSGNTGLDELAGNLTQGRTEFQNELIKAAGDGCDFYLMIEDGNWRMLRDGVYESQYNSKSFIASLKAYEARWGVRVNFVDSNLSAWWVYHTFKYYLREYLL